jgi:hypothetical protein
MLLFIPPRQFLALLGLDLLLPIGLLLFSLFLLKGSDFLDGFLVLRSCTACALPSLFFGSCGLGDGDMAHRGEVYHVGRVVVAFI